jgi:hypothetical protein
MNLTPVQIIGLQDNLTIILLFTEFLFSGIWLLNGLPARILKGYLYFHVLKEKCNVVKTDTYADTKKIAADIPHRYAGIRKGDA